MVPTAWIYSIQLGFCFPQLHQHLHPHLTCHMCVAYSCVLCRDSWTSQHATCGTMCLMAVQIPHGKRALLRAWRRGFPKHWKPAFQLAGHWYFHWLAAWVRGVLLPKYFIPVNDLTLLVGQQEWHLACKSPPHDIFKGCCFSADFLL